jgi:hypothetical protein
LARCIPRLSEKWSSSKISEPETIGAKEMSRISFMLLIVTGLALTVYFGTAAWRLTDDSHLDITGRIPPVTK